MPPGKTNTLVNHLKLYMAQYATQIRLKPLGSIRSIKMQAYLWKTYLLTEEPDNKEADRVGDVLGRIHAASTGTGFDKHLFQLQYPGGSASL